MQVTATEKMICVDPTSDRKAQSTAPASTAMLPPQPRSVDGDRRGPSGDPSHARSHQPRPGAQPRRWHGYRSLLHPCDTQPRPRYLLHSRLPEQEIFMQENQTKSPVTGRPCAIWCHHSSSDLSRVMLTYIQTEPRL